MIRIRIHAESADTRNQFLKALSSRALSRAAAAAEGEALQTLAGEVRARCPVDGGALKASVAVERPVAKDGSVSGGVVVREHYAAFVEFGTSEQAAQPFLRPAVMACESRMERQIAGSLHRSEGTF